MTSRGCRPELRSPVRLAHCRQTRIKLFSRRLSAARPSYKQIPCLGLADFVAVVRCRSNQHRFDDAEIQCGGNDSFQSKAPRPQQVLKFVRGAFASSGPDQHAEIPPRQVLMEKRRLHLEGHDLLHEKKFVSAQHCFTAVFKNPKALFVIPVVNYAL